MKKDVVICCLSQLVNKKWAGLKINLGIIKILSSTIIQIVHKDKKRYLLNYSSHLAGKMDTWIFWSFPSYASFLAVSANCGGYSELENSLLIFISIKEFDFVNRFYPNFESQRIEKNNDFNFLPSKSHYGMWMILLP